MRIPIAKVKEWREQIDTTHLIVFAIGRDGKQHVATHGETEQNAKEAATAGNKLKGALGWPETLCRALPLERLCKNCVFYKPDMRGEKQIGVTFERKDVEQNVLLEAAQCLDDCLIRIYPEEFEQKYIDEARERWGKQGGTIGRITDTADRLREIKAQPTVQDVMKVLEDEGLAKTVAKQWRGVLEEEGAG